MRPTKHVPSHAGRSKRRGWPALAALALCAGACGAAQTTEPAFQDIVVSARPITLAAGDPSVDEVGRLAWRGTLVLEASHRRFGGLSGLRVSADGKSAVAITDRGSFLTFDLDYGDDGRLAGVHGARIGPMLDEKGNLLTDEDVDSEGLEVLADDRLAVSFEHRHRIAVYPPLIGEPAPALATFAPPSALGAMADNQGMEALVRVDEGSLLALVEHAPGEGPHRGALVAISALDDAAHALPGKTVTLQAAPRFDITDAALGPDGMLYVLERSFDPMRGPGMRLRRVSKQEREGGSAWTGETLAELDTRYAIDNMEGLSARLGPSGETLLYVVSDDNFNLLQRTMLMLFAVRE
ncbi:MAG: esterase-like activity of phytase family protein [Alphaproteobacteria bacterium]|nr:esterase-like activity of phytase family protein [Alphaproteobacteria bacterium]